MSMSSGHWLPFLDMSAIIDPCKETTDLIVYSTIVTIYGFFN